jgi:signal transduction histidine kinase
MAALILGLLAFTLNLRKISKSTIKEDPRINTSFISIKEYLLIFAAMAAFNGFHMWLYQVFYARGIIDTNLHFVISFLMTYVMIIAAFITGLIAFIRHTSWNRPMKKLSEALHKIANGDFSVKIAPLRKDGKKDYIEVMFDDFNIMAQELQSIETMKTDFIANVSHEIKTPLSVIQNYAAALQSETLTADERSDYAKTIIEASQKLSLLVSNILKLNKLENQEILPEARPFDLGEQIRRCAVAFEDLWERKNISFEAELEEVIVSYDTHMLEIVWNNLFSNAIKFTNRGGSIFVSLKAKAGFAYVAVSDTGCGMDEDTQKRIFDKFYQGDSSRYQEGNGLGLALVKRTISLMGGTVTVESKPEQGSVFTVCLKI